MGDTDRIIQLVSQQPGLRAKQIAKLLGLQKKDVNSALHGTLRSQVVQDESYGWWIKDQSIKAPPQEIMQEVGAPSPQQKEQILPDQAVIATIPAPGQLVEVRRRHYVVTDVQKSTLLQFQ